MAIRYCYLVEYEDRRCGVIQRERFLWPADARTRVRQLREAGFYSVRYRQQRVHAGGPPSSSRPGVYRNGCPIAGMDFAIKNGQLR